MWGPGPWGAPMWGFGWIFPLIGLLLFLICVIAMIRFMSGGRRFMCMGGHDSDGTDEPAKLRREIHELREEVKQLKENR